MKLKIEFHVKLRMDTVLLRSTGKKITKDKSGDNGPHLAITEGV